MIGDPLPGGDYKPLEEKRGERREREWREIKSKSNQETDWDGLEGSLMALARCYISLRMKTITWTIIIWIEVIKIGWNSYYRALPIPTKPVNEPTTCAYASKLFHMQKYTANSFSKKNYPTKLNVRECKLIWNNNINKIYNFANIRLMHFDSSALRWTDFQGSIPRTEDCVPWTFTPGWTLIWCQCIMWRRYINWSFTCERKGACITVQIRILPITIARLARPR